MVLKFSEMLRSNFGKIVDAGIDLVLNIVQGIANGLPALIEYVPTIISNIAGLINDNAPKILKAGFQIIITLLSGLIQAIPTLIANIPQIIQAIVDVFTAFQWVNLGKKIIDFFAQGIKGMVSSVVNAAKNIVSAITDGGGLKDLPKMALQWGKDMLDNFVQGIKNKIGALKDAVFGIANTIKGFIGFSEPEEGPLSNFHTYAPDMMKLFAKGITDNAGLLKDSFNKSLDFGSSANFGIDQYGTASVPAQSSYSAAAAGLGNVFNITVNGAKYSDEQSLARYIAQEIQYMEERRRATFATA